MGSNYSNMKEKEGVVLETNLSFLITWNLRNKTKMEDRPSY